MSVKVGAVHPIRSRAFGPMRWSATFDTETLRTIDVRLLNAVLCRLELPKFLPSVHIQFDRKSRELARRIFDTDNRNKLGWCEAGIECSYSELDRESFRAEIVSHLPHCVRQRLHSC